MTPVPLDDVERSRLEQLLREQRSDAEADVTRLRRSLDDVRLARSDGTADDEHDPEGSTLSSDWSQLIGLQNAAVARIAAVDRTLERIAAGRYGICVGCGRPVVAARLAARPTAESCVDCAI